LSLKLKLISEVSGDTAGIKKLLMNFQDHPFYRNLFSTPCKTVLTLVSQLKYVDIQ